MTTNSTAANALRPTLWVLTILFGAANVTASALGLNMLLGAGFGALTLACATGLVVNHYKNRRLK